MDKGLYNYFDRKYKPEILGNSFIIEIPYSDSSRNIDDFMKEKEKEGYHISESYFLRRFYLIKSF